jgi:hypothetical protein
MKWRTLSHDKGLSIALHAPSMQETPTDNGCTGIYKTIQLQFDNIMTVHTRKRKVSLGLDTSAVARVRK